MTVPVVQAAAGAGDAVAGRIADDIIGFFGAKNDTDTARAQCHLERFEEELEAMAADFDNVLLDIETADMTVEDGVLSFITTVDVHLDDGTFVTGERRVEIDIAAHLPDDLPPAAKAADIVQQNPETIRQSMAAAVSDVIEQQIVPPVIERRAETPAEADTYADAIESLGGMAEMYAEVADEPAPTVAFSPRQVSAVSW